MIVKETTSTNSPIYEDALSIRHEVFITEQNVPFEREIEGEEGKHYFVGYVGTTAAVCARAFLRISRNLARSARRMPQGISRQASCERIDALYRKKKASDSGIRLITLGAQDQVTPSHERLGFKTIGEGFLEAGIPHHRMDKEI